MTIRTNRRKIDICRLAKKHLYRVLRHVCMQRYIALCTPNIDILRIRYLLIANIFLMFI